MAGVIQGLDLNFNLYLLTLFNGEYSSNIEFILSKSNSIDRFTSCWSNWKALDKSLSK